MDTAEQIARELAAEESPTGNMSQCAFCSPSQSDDDDDLGYRDAANHEPSCLWRRARELYPAAVVR